MKIVLATNNSHKIKEYRSLFANMPIEVLSLSDVAIKSDIEETGTSYEENAAIKAENIAKMTKNLVIADDSGLEISALGGSPGLNSARFAAQHKSQSEANRAILKSLEKSDNRQARFVCVIALANYHGRLNLFRGECLGRILMRPEGDSGFGYDPIFFSDEANACFAAIGEDEKNRYSHRAKAVEQLLAYLADEKFI